MDADKRTDNALFPRTRNAARRFTDLPVASLERVARKREPERLGASGAGMTADPLGGGSPARADPGR